MLQGLTAAVLYLGVVLLEASRSEKDEAGEVGGLALQAACHSVYQQGGTSQAVPHSPQPVRLLRLAVCLLLVCTAAAAASAVHSAALLAFHPVMGAKHGIEGCLAASI